MSKPPMLPLLPNEQCTGKKMKTLHRVLLVLGVVAILFVTYVIVIAILGMVGGRDTLPESVSLPPVASTTPSPPPVPGAPVACEESPEPGFVSLPCFPPNDITGSRFIKGVKKKTGWDCYRKGQYDKFDNQMRHEQGCVAQNNVDQPYKIKGLIGYDEFGDAKIKAMREVELQLSLSAWVDQGQRVTKKDMLEYEPGLFRMMARQLWPRHTEIRAEAIRAHDKIFKKCLNGGDRSNSYGRASERITSGYVIACHPIESLPISSTVDGRLVSYYSSVSVKASYLNGRWFS